MTVLPWSSDRKIILYLWLRVILWCALIFFFSAFPSYEGKVVNFETLKGTLEFLSRKAAHLGEYFLLMVFVFKALAKSRDPSGRGNLLWAFLFSVGYAVSDEWHQSFVYGRNGTVMDVFIDGVGALCGLGYCLKAGRSKEQKLPG